jgi:uncharacterized membrane protein YgaE (UPF0421/DUF939 family)
LDKTNWRRSSVGSDQAAATEVFSLSTISASLQPSEFAISWLTAIQDSPPAPSFAPMTTVLLLKPDFHQTFVRGVARIVGTFAGAVATLIVAALRSGPIAIGILIVVFAGLCYSLPYVNYAIYVVCVTSYIVFLLAFSGLPNLQSHRFRYAERLNSQPSWILR